MNLINKTKEFFENLSKKQLLTILGTIPIGFVLGVAFYTLSAKMRVSFKKYNTETFSMIDSLSIDTIFKKNGELDTDTLIDYYKLSRKDIQFKTLDNLDSEGFLFVRDKEISEYNLLENNVPSNKTFGQKNEAKTYFLVGDFFGKDFKLNKLELTTYGATSNLDDSFNPKILPRQKYLNYKIYTRETDLGNKMLDDEQANVRKYLNKILEHKKSLKD